MKASRGCCKKRLERMRFKIDIAVSAEKGIERLQREKFDSCCSITICRA